jgi:dihydrofolate reductase
VNRLIAAIDRNRGIADDSGIPWQGRIPSDSHYFVDQTSTGTIVMGYRTYAELSAPLGQSPNLVAVRAGSSPPLRAGFVPVVDLEPVLGHGPGTDAQGVVWIIGGAGLFAQSMPFADELYLTRLEADFTCTKFFPEFESDFHLLDSQPPLSENGIEFQFQIWRRDGAA